MANYRSPNVVFDRSMINSDVYRSLSRIATQALSQFLARRQFEQKGRTGKKTWCIKNNGEIEFPYRYAQKIFKISEPTFRRAIDELIEKGFISISAPGNGSGGGKRTKYSIDERWKNWGQPDFTIVQRKKACRKLGFMKTKATVKNDGDQPSNLTADQGKQ